MLPAFLLGEFVAFALMQECRFIVVVVVNALMQISLSQLFTEFITLFMMTLKNKIVKGGPFVKNSNICTQLSGWVKTLYLHELDEVLTATL